MAYWLIKRTDFKSLVIKHLKGLQRAEAYLEPKRESVVEFFCEYTY